MKNSGKLITPVVLGVLVWLGFATALRAVSADRDAAAAFDKLKSLSGQWEAQMGEHKIVTTFEVASNGTAVLERMSGHGVGDMLTVYYLEGDRIVLTHYCTSGTQPHMAAKAAPGSDELHFKLAGTSGLTSADQGHMDEVVVRFDGSDKVNEDWTWRENGKVGQQVALRYHRIS